MSSIKFSILCAVHKLHFSVFLKVQHKFQKQFSLVHKLHFSVFFMKILNGIRDVYLI